MADPNLANKEGLTALSFALQTENQEIVEKLASVTTDATNYKNIIPLLASNKKLKIGDEIKLLIKKIKDNGQHSLLLEKSSFFGNEKVLKNLLDNNIEWKKLEIENALKNAIMVDNKDCVQTIKDFWQKEHKKENILTEEVESLALERGNTDILIILEIPFKTQTEFKIPNTDLDYNKIPKSEEFPYFQLNKLITDLIKKSNGNLIPFDTILEALRVPPVHYKRDQHCDNDCKQKVTCQRIREVNGLIDQMMEILSEKFPIFKDFSTIVVGSLKEVTKIGQIDETDVTLMLSDRLKKHLEFDRKEQRIMMVRK